MSASEYIYLGAASLSLCLALAAAVHKHRSVSRWCFAVGMFVLAGEQICSLLAAQSRDILEIHDIQRWRLTLSAFLPAPWLAFSFIYGKENPEETLAGKKWLFVVLAVVPPLLVILFGDGLLLSPPPRPIDEPLELDLIPGRPGFVLLVYLLLASVFIAANLERILRASIGAIRDRIKFYVLGILVLFAARIYTTAQSLLFSSISTDLMYVEALSLGAADILIIVGLLKGARHEIRFYVSQEFLNSSITLLSVGLYLLGLGIVYKLSALFHLLNLPFMNASLLIIGSVGMIALLSSNAFRHGIRDFVQKHFEHPRYDYRNIWSNFVHRTNLVRTERDLANITARLLSEVFGVSSVSIWLWDDKQKTSRCIGSTSLVSCTPDDSMALSQAQQEISFLMHSVGDATGPVDLTPNTLNRFSKGQATGNDRSSPQGQISYCAPLLAGTNCLGLITLNSRFNRVPFDEQDFNLLDVLSRQVAGILYTKSIGRELEQARQMQAFQAFSAFFVHDLKNVASSLSLTLQNLPLHYDNPEFREDALQLLAQGVEKINTLCGRLSFFKEGIRLRRTPADLNQIVISTLEAVDEPLRACVTLELSSLPQAPIDEEAMGKVVLNLLLNAREAVSQGVPPRIVLKTSEESGFVVLSVTDNGCGMDEAFMENSLFQPFETTKKKGLGIGLYQCKQIVEDHGGMIRVESIVGSGTSFRIFLPCAEGALISEN